MYYKEISALLVFFFFSLFFLQGCSDDSISPSGTFVNGMVSGSANNPLPNLKVKIGNESTLTNANGFFSFKNISFPYDIVIIDEASKSQMLIKSLSMQNIIIPDFLTTKNPDLTCFLDVNIPSGFIQPGKKGKLIFTNGYDINSTKDIVSEKTELEIKMNGYTVTKGKMIILIYTTDDSANIVSYENYFEKNAIDILPDYHLHFDIDSSQLSFNPVERRLWGKIHTPAGYNSSQQYFYLNFATKNISFNNPDCKFSTITNDYFNFIVPVDLPSEFSVMVNNYISNPTGDKYCLETFKLQENASSVLITPKLPPDLVSPAENAVNVNSKTEISHTGGEGTGVFVTRFVKDGYICSVITSSASFLFSELDKFEIGNTDNSYFFWTVQKYGETSNLNSYLTSYPGDGGVFVSKAEQRMFKTAP